MLNLSKTYLPLLATASLLTLAACSTIDEEYEPQSETQGVLTDIHIAISPQTTDTRQTATVTQAAENATFRGIQDIYLIPFSINSDAITANDYRLGNRIDLPALASFSDPSANSISGLFTNNNSRYYTNVEVPLGTNAFLFYGKAIRSGSNNFVDGLTAITGLTNTGVANQPSGISFAPSAIVSSTNATSATEKANGLAACLTAVANAAGWSDNILYKADRDKLLTMTAGSSASICALLQEIYDKYHGRTDEVATAIVAAIGTYTDVNEGTLSMKTDYASYPSSFNLPDGAAYVKWVEDTETPANSKFQAITTATTSEPNTGVNTGLTAQGLTSYAYPAELYYRVNSKIKTDDTNTHADDYSTTPSWDGDNGLLSKYPYPDATHAATVNRNTKSIAIKDQIQYAVGRLDLKIETAAKSNTEDADGTLRDAKDKVITVGENTFPIKGILIGNQRPVNFEFHPDGTDSYVLYDTAFGSGTDSDPYTFQNLVSGGTVGPNYTLVYETPEATSNTDENAIVNFAIELENRSGMPFVGLNEMIIPDGTRFYLIGQINPKSRTTGTANQVFKQDHFTKVTATINSLANAYNVVPDFRDLNLKLSLDVIDWKLSTPSSSLLK